MSNGFVVKYEDLYKISQEYKKELDGFKDSVDITSNKIAEIINNGSFTGATADSIKYYLSDVHLTILASMKTLAQNMEDQVALYKAGYYSVDNTTNFVLDEEAINSYRSDLDSQLGTVLDRKEIVDSAINSIHDLLPLGKPGISGVTSAHNGVNTEMNTLKNNVSTLESATVQALDGSTEVFLEYLKNSVNVIKGNTFQMVDYTPNSFFTNKDVYTLANLSEYFYKQHSDNEDIYEDIWTAEKEKAEAARQRATEGVWKTVGGVALVVTGVVCIVATAGAATPIVAAGAVAGGGTIAFGVADAAEGGQEIYYGNIGDIDSQSFNMIRDTVFQGNQQVYQITESVFAFSASAMVPIGAASKAHALTFRSGAVAVGKLAISSASGAGASKLTMDATGNRALSMIVGMATTTATGFGLNAIDNRFSISGGSVSSVQYGTEDIKDYEYNMIEKPGPLADMDSQPAKNFYGGRYNKIELTEDTVLYRAGNADKPLGQWFTKEPPKSVAQVRIDTAVKPYWTDPKTGALTGESVVDTVYAIKIPKGTTIYSGPVGPQGGAYCGGYNIEQIFVNEPWKLNVDVVSSYRIK